MTNIGQELISCLSANGVDVIFGIPGVHTIELYRGLSGSSIRHVTPRHEQGAGFMADGYARVSGRPGVAFVITGPGFTNTLTAMGQARADSIPIIVISSENPLSQLRKGKGLLHELPDQHGMAKLIAVEAFQIQSGHELLSAFEKSFETLAMKKPGPVHIEIPMDVAQIPFDDTKPSNKAPVMMRPDEAKIANAIALMKASERPVIIAGGGAKKSSLSLRMLAERLDAPVVQTVNARGVLHDHPLSVPASPSLKPVRDLIEQADLVLALGTEFGQTDFDMYATDTMPVMQSLIRIDLSQDQLSTTSADISIRDDVDQILPIMSDALDNYHAETDGALRAQTTRDLAFEDIGADMRKLTKFLNEMRDASPNAIMVGDSAQPIYAGNLYYDHDRPQGWFNAATGYGALGYAIPASIGAAVAAPDAEIICITGDGGAQFSLPELMVAKQENLNITFVIWNNYGYQEIETSMQAVGVEPIGCDANPPDFEAIAKSFDLPFQRYVYAEGRTREAIITAQQSAGPSIIEIIDND